MYETEANHKIESSGKIPSEVVSALAELKGRILARTVLPWSEHCTECVWPTCYSTCDLYSPRVMGDAEDLPMVWLEWNARRLSILIC